LIVTECNGDVKHRESANRDDQADFAVNGALSPLGSSGRRKMFSAPAAIAIAQAGTRAS
jgi:hypothetical protein